jgi:hypothetical protein
MSLSTIFWLLPVHWRGTKPGGQRLGDFSYFGTPVVFDHANGTAYVLTLNSDSVIMQLLVIISARQRSGQVRWYWSRQYEIDRSAALPSHSVLLVGG